MASFQSKIFRFLLKNRHLLKGQWKKPVIDFNTSIEALRADAERTAQKMAKIPENVQVSMADVSFIYAEWLIPKDALDEQVILYFHGGGFVMGSCNSNRSLVAKFTDRCKIKALLFDYSLAPEHPYPAAIEDSSAIYQWLLGKGFLPKNIVFAGDSAGGGIALGTLLFLKDRHLPLPAGVVAFSPCTDLTCSGRSHITKAKADPATPKGANDTYMSYYKGEGDPTSPYMSPLFGDLSGLPPIMIQVGEDETLLDDSVRFAKKAEEMGSPVSLHVWQGMFHCFPLLAPMFPEATLALEEACAFIHARLV